MLTDEATLARLEGAINLTPLFTRDNGLLNTYAVAILTTARRDRSGKADLLARWLTEPAGQARIGSFRINGRPVFFTWPSGVDAGTPESVPPQR